MNHGTRSCYVQHKCRCAPCTQANRDYQRNRERHHARVRYGIEDPKPDRLIDADEVRDHIAFLRSKGIGLRTIAEHTGLGRTALQQLASGESRQVQPANAMKILAVPATAQPAVTLVDARPTWQLIRQLRRVGVPKVRIAEAIGQTRALQLGRKRIQLRHAQAIQDAYERLLAENRSLR